MLYNTLMHKSFLIGIFCSILLFFAYYIGERANPAIVLLGYSICLVITSLGLKIVVDGENTNKTHSPSKSNIALVIIFLLTISASLTISFLLSSLNIEVRQINLLISLFAVLTPFFLSFLASYYYFIQLGKSIRKKSKSTTIFLIFAWIIYSVYTTSITLSFVGGNGFSPKSASPLFIAYFDRSWWTGDAVEILLPNLQWYDYLLLVAVVTPSDGLNDFESYYKNIYKLDSQLSYEETLAYLQANHIEAYEHLKRGGTCNFNGKEQSPQISLPTRTYFGLYYKNFLVSCDFVDFATNIGVGSGLPRVDKKLLN